MKTTEQLFASPHIDNITFKNMLMACSKSVGKDAPDYTLTELEEHFRTLPVYIQNAAFQWGLGSEEFLAMVRYCVTQRLKVEVSP